MRLIERLTEEHRVILALLNDVASLGVGSLEGRKKLLKSKELILSHLHKEDEQLYPELARIEQALLVSDAFKEEMVHVSNKVLRFFCEFEKDSQDTQEMAQAFSDIRTALRNRITREELELYPLFVQYVEET